MLSLFSATWQALREVFPDAIIKGCVFHWTQRLYKKIASLGLSTSYMDRRDKFLFMRKLMSLPFLPHEHISPAFEELRLQAITSQIQPLIDLTSYIHGTWIAGSVWKPENWSVYRETVRTNNDVEGGYRCGILPCFIKRLAIFTSQ